MPLQYFCMSFTDDQIVVRQDVFDLQFMGKVSVLQASNIVPLFLCDYTLLELHKRI